MLLKVMQVLILLKPQLKDTESAIKNKLKVVV